MTLQTRIRRMIINLKPGDCIRVPSKELPKSSSPDLIETEVLEVRRDELGWYRVLTTVGDLLPHQPNDKYELVEKITP